MSRLVLHEMVSQPPRRELRALLAGEVPEEGEGEEGAGSAMLAALRRSSRVQLPRGPVPLVCLALGTLAVVLLAGGSAPWVIRVAGSAEVELASMLEGLSCHTARVGERCYTDVVWAMRHRDVHPEWYIGLNKCSDFHDFQGFMHSQVLNSGQRRCPKPCGSGARTPPKGRGPGVAACKVKKQKGKCHNAVPGEDCYAHMIYTKSEADKYPNWYPGITEESTFTDVQYYLYTERVCPMPCVNRTLSKRDKIDGCHTARPGDTCFADILLAKTKFIETHPSWYKGLTNQSSNDEFQAFLHAQKHEGSTAAKKACPAPCNHTAIRAVEETSNCKTAEAGDPCYESVLWGATVGMQEHPDWYPGLAVPGSSFEEFQAHLHKDNRSKCIHVPCPCQRPVKGDMCYKTAMWVLSDGLRLHPDRFAGLTKESSFDEVQLALHDLRTTACGRPCKTFDEDSRSPWRKRRSATADADAGWP